jgi:hypothetical protein
MPNRAESALRVVLNHTVYQQKKLAVDLEHRLEAIRAREAELASVSRATTDEELVALRIIRMAQRSALDFGELLYRIKVFTFRSRLSINPVVHVGDGCHHPACATLRRHPPSKCRPIGCSKFAEGEGVRLLARFFCYLYFYLSKCSAQYILLLLPGPAEDAWRFTSVDNGVPTRLSWGWIAWGEGVLALDSFNLQYQEPFSHDERCVLW